jgi:hypothetical protein
MEVIAVLVVAFVAWWIWRVLQSDKETGLDFDVWVAKYESASSPFKASKMAVSFLSESIHSAWSVGAITSKEREAVTAVLKGLRATTTLTLWLGSMLPAVARAVGEEELPNIPANTVGMLMLLAWMAPAGQGEDAVRRFLFRR